MPRLLGNLSYKTEKVLPIFRPVDDIAALYKKKDEDYNYVIEGKHTIDNILAQMPYNENDAPIIQGAKEKVRNVFEDWSKKGDFENRIIDVKNLANDIATKHGLFEVQKNAKAREDFIKIEKERLARGLTTPEAYNRALTDADTKYSGVQKDPLTGNFRGEYKPREVLEALNHSDRVAKALAGFKANGYVLDPTNGQPVYLKNEMGEQIVRDPNGTGFMISSSGKTVSEGELARAASAWLATDPKYQAKVQDDLYYELDSILYNRDTGERREMTVGDLERLVGTKVTKEVATKFGLDNIENLQENLESQGASVEDLYKQIRKGQMLNSTIQFGVEKESFVEYDNRYYQDWMLAAGSGDSSMTSKYGFMDTYKTTTTYTSEDTERVSRTLQSTDDQIQAVEKELTNPNLFTEDREKKQQELEGLKAAKVELGRKASETIKQSPEVTKMVDKLVSNDFSENLEGVRGRSASPSGVGRGNLKGLDKVEGLSINTGSARQLVYKALANELTDTELQQYIKLDRNKELAESYKKFANEVPFMGAKAGSPYSDEKYNAILNGGEKALESMGEDVAIKNRILSDYNSKLNLQTNTLRNGITRAANLLKEKVDKGEVPYNQKYKLLTIPPDVKPEERRTHPFYQIDHQLKAIPERNSEFYKQLSTSFGKETIPDAIQNELEKMKGYDDNKAVEKGRVNFDKATMVASFDIVPDSEGNYHPSVLLKVPVKSNDGDSTDFVQLAINNPEESFRAVYTEGMVKFKNDLIRKDRTVGLLESEEILLDQANRALYNLSPYGKALDNLDLYNVEMGNDGKPAVIPFTYWDKKRVNIEAYKYGSPQNMAFYLTDPDAVDDAKYWAVKKDGKYGKVTEEQLKGNEWTALGGNDPQDLKYLFGKMIFESNIDAPNTYKVPEKDLTDITPIFGGNIKEGVTPRVNKAVVDKVEVLKHHYPNLYITDSLRSKDVKYGEEDSNHKYGTALDFRTVDPETGQVNEDAIKLTRLSPSVLKGMGIKQIINEGDHIHVEFL